jgi:phosphoribosylglycinamide formyltransferase-1
MSRYRVAVLVSGSGSNLQALIDARAQGELPIELALVGSDRAAFLPLARPKNHAARAAWELQLADLVNLFQPDLLVFSGFMRVLSASFIERCAAPAINQHPALLPDDGGDMVTTSGGLTIPALRGAHVVPDALRLGLPVTGCTIHRVTPIGDDGPVLARAEVPILRDDTEETLHERIKAEERRLVVEVVAKLAGA